MGYATQYTGGDADSRRSEADKLIEIINDCDLSLLTDKERDFVEEMSWPESLVSGKQLLWLRDIKDKLI